MGCSYANKAINVQNSNGKVMLLASDSNIIDEEFNVDDFIEKPSIPSIIITKDFGDIIREYYKYNNGKNGEKSIKHIILNMKFSGVKMNGKVEIDLFFRSDDKKIMNRLAMIYLIFLEFLVSNKVIYVQAVILNLIFKIQEQFYWKI